MSTFDPPADCNCPEDVPADELPCWPCYREGRRPIELPARDECGRFTTTI